ncbi:MAG: hypothetical protein K8U03_26750 [Planctomycetia bacterium]|nr:hypothetical protein [Planctomycetia bacterium]
MPTLEDEAYQRLVDRLNERRITVISAHPPSGKAYDSELVRIPAKERNSGRYHADIIFVIDTVLFICELKGKSSESTSDVAKLRGIIADYTVAELVSFIRKRTNVATVNWAAITKVVGLIGVVVGDASLPDDIVSIVASAPAEFEVDVGNTLPDASGLREALARVF